MNEEQSRWNAASWCKAPAPGELEAGLGHPRARQSPRGTWRVREEPSKLGSTEAMKGLVATK